MSLLPRADRDLIPEPRTTDPFSQLSRDELIASLEYAAELLANRDHARTYGVAVSPQEDDRRRVQAFREWVVALCERRVRGGSR